MRLPHLLGPAIILLMTVLICPGASAFWPLSWQLGDEHNYLGPLVTVENKGAQTESVTIRPLLFLAEPQKETYQFLYPLGKTTEGNSHFVPFYSANFGKDYRNYNLLLFFYGQNAEKTYGGFFPVYGTLIERFRRDKISFFLWPLYGHSEVEGGTRTDILWPFFSFYGGKDGGFKAWPLFGTRKRGDERVTSFFLWPFFMWDRKDLDTDNPKESFFAIPFFLKTTSPQSVYYSSLPPFFSYYRNPDKKVVNAPWPFYTYTEGEVEARSYWPIYATDRREAFSTLTVMWPVYKRTEWAVGPQENSEQRILLFNRRTMDDRGFFLNVWPFFEYRSRETNKRFFFPSLLPFRYEEMDRIIKPLLTLYEYKENGSTRLSNFLYGLYTKEETDETWKRRFAFLLEVSKEKDGMGFEVLSGLFGIDARTIRILYVPIKRGAQE